MTDERPTSTWFWVFVGMAASGLAVAVVARANPARELVLDVAWLTGWMAIAGLLFIVKIVRD